MGSDSILEDEQYDVILDPATHHALSAYGRVLTPEGVYIMVGDTLAEPIESGKLISVVLGKAVITVHEMAS